MNVFTQQKQTDLRNLQFYQGKGQLGSQGWTWTYCCISHGEPARTCCPAQGTLLNPL